MNAIVNLCVEIAIDDQMLLSLINVCMQLVVKNRR